MPSLPDEFDALAAEQGRLSSRPQLHARYGGTCWRCGSHVMLEMEGQPGGIGSDLLVRDDEGAWVHADCLE